MFSLVLLFVLSPYTAVLACCISVLYLYNNRSKIEVNIWNVGLILLFIWSFFVGIINESSMSIIVSFLFLIYFCLSIYVGNQWATEDRINMILHYLLKASIFSGFIGILEKIIFEFYPIPLWSKWLGLPATTSSAHRIFSTFGNPNIAGDWFAIMVVISLFFEGRTTSKREKEYYYVLVIFFLINLFFTGSRGAFVAMISGLIVFFMFKCSKYNKIIFMGIIILVIIIGFMPEKVPNISQIIVGHKIGRSFTLRERIWSGSFAMFMQKPFTGWGMTGTIEHGKNFINYTGIVHHPHNIFLGFMTSLGVVGLSIYLTMRLFVYKNMVLLLRKNREGYIQLLISIQAIIIVHGIVDFTIIVPQIGSIFIASSAIIISMSKDINKNKNNKDSDSCFRINEKM